MDMGLRIKERRLALDMTQEELATKLGLQKSAIAKYENGRVENIKRSVIQQMAQVLRCSPSYLMGWIDDPDPNSNPSLKEQSAYDMDQRVIQYRNSIAALLVLDKYRSADPVTQKNVRLILGVSDDEND